MRSKEQLAERVREACHNPLLVAIGASCATPSKAASTANALGLSNDEEKLAKDVAILKRDAQALFGTDFLTAMQHIQMDDSENLEEVEMNVEFGSHHYQRIRERHLVKQVIPFVRRFFPSADGFKCRIRIEGLTPVVIVDFVGRSGLEEEVLRVSGILGLSAGEQSVRFAPARFSIYNHRLFHRVTKLAAAWEQRVSKDLCKIQNCPGATIVKEY